MNNQYSKMTKNDLLNIIYKFKKNDLIQFIETKHGGGLNVSRIPIKINLSKKYKKQNKINVMQNNKIYNNYNSS
jgi:hypothetical protein